MVYSLSSVDVLEVRKVAGRIVPALATTTAMVAGNIIIALIIIIIIIIMYHRTSRTRSTKNCDRKYIEKKTSSSSTK
jgi:uncharacterized membrane protein